MDKPPQRIICLVPSITELLYDLGLENRIVGITRYCVHPPQALKEKRVVGGTKKIINKRLLDLEPDLIICNKEENTSAMVGFCSTVATTYVSDISTLEESLEMIQQLGELTDTIAAASTISSKINALFRNIKPITKPIPAIYLIWKNPYMSIGTDTFIHDMMEKAGFENAVAPQTRYPQLELEDLVRLEPQVVLLSSEPYNFKSSDAVEICSAFAKAEKKPPQCLIVNGELFSWYGSRMLKSPEYFKELRAQIEAESVTNSR
ncbi:helical backbone metal receptor [Nonlabens marinus]|uniref:helical backbone metal receptor n=1 Tax=Nonlabens marinus TaxID=930802 RepID=UPI001E2F9EAA|nr:helical backbone metal receptor [Nonlabens marinus]